MLIFLTSIQHYFRYFHFFIVFEFNIIKKNRLAIHRIEVPYNLRGIIGMVIVYFKPSIYTIINNNFNSTDTNIKRHLRLGLLYLKLGMTE